MMQGRYIRMRAMTESDGEFVRTLRNSSRVRNQFLDRLLVSEQRQRRFLASLADSESEFYLIAEVIESGKPFGVFFLRDIQHRHQRAEAGVFCDDGADQGVPVFEGLYLLYDYAFNTLNLRKLVARVLKTNDRGMRLNRLVGMKEEGVFRDHVFGDGGFLDVVSWCLFRDDFNSRPSESMAFVRSGRHFDANPEEESL